MLWKCIQRTQIQDCLLSIALHLILLYAIPRQSDRGVLPSDAQNANCPAAEELLDPPVRKLPAADEEAAPLSVAAPVLDADWANAGTAPAAAANAADMTASIVIVLFIFVPFGQKLFIGYLTLFRRVILIYVYGLTSQNVFPYVQISWP